MTPEQRRERARLAAYSRWARPYAREEQAEAARRAWWHHLERQVDPDVLMPPEQRDRLVQAQARAYMSRLRMQRRSGRTPSMVRMNDDSQPQGGLA